jgi:hypothetical protein
MPGSHRPLRSATLLAAALLAVALAGCGNSNDTSHTGTHGDGTHRPVTTSDADWTSVIDALGRTGKFGDNNTVYRIPLVRSDLQVVTVGTPAAPAIPAANLPEHQQRTECGARVGVGVSRFADSFHRGFMCAPYRRTRNQS